MPQSSLPADAIGLPITRRDVEAKIDLLIDLLDQLDTDPDLEPDTDEDGADDEPSLGFSTGGFMPEFQRQEGRRFHINADGGQDLEQEHDGREPGEDSEPDVDDECSLGWTDNLNQASAGWQANHLGTVDLEEGVGAVRKKRAVSRTGGRVLTGANVF